MPSRISPDGSKPLEGTLLFKPLKLGRYNLEHRVLMAPLTRMRGTKVSDGVYVPGDLNVEYYSQRASKGGFQLTEACPISRYVSLVKNEISLLAHPKRQQGIPESRASLPKSKRLVGGE